MRRGAFDVIRSPWCPTDIELCVIRAVREEKYNISKTTAKPDLSVACSLNVLNVPTGSMSNLDT
jgi:hypothetical protein